MASRRSIKSGRTCQAIGHCWIPSKQSVSIYTPPKNLRHKLKFYIDSARKRAWNFAIYHNRVVCARCGWSKGVREHRDLLNGIADELETDATPFNAEGDYGKHKPQPVRGATLRIEIKG